MRQSSINPYIAVAIAVLAVSTTAIFVKLAGGAPAGIIAFYRLVFALVILAPIAFSKYRHEFKLLNKSDWVVAIISGILFALHLLFWFESLQYTSIASSVIIITLNPVFFFIGSYFIFGERFSVATFISLLIVLMGTFIIGFGDFQISRLALFGDIFAFISMAIFAGYLLLGQRLQRSLSLITYTSITYGSGAVFLLIYNLIFGNQFVGHTTNVWGWLILLAIVPTFFGQVILNWSLKWLSTTRISLALVFEPIAAAILGFIVIGDKVTPFQMLGGTIIIFGLFLFTMSTTKRRGLTVTKRQ